MRERFTYRGDSLWWFTELYLHKMRRLDTAVAVTLALEALRAREAPARLRVDTDDRVGPRRGAARSARAHGIPVERDGTGIASRAAAMRGSFLIGLTARLSRLRPARAIVPRQAARRRVRPHGVLARVDRRRRPRTGELHRPGARRRSSERLGAERPAAMSASARGRISARGAGGIRSRRSGARVRSSRRSSGSRAASTLDGLARAVAPAPASSRRPSPPASGVRAAGTFRGCDLWPVLRRELEGVALLQWPWSARAMDEAGAGARRA